MHEPDDDEYTRSVGYVLRGLYKRIKTSFCWAKHRVSHKLAHIKPNNLLDVLSKHGLALVIIIIAWEIIEDILFPLWFIWLGKNVHPIFLAGAPAAWLICLHWLMVPLTWSLWVKCKKVLRKED
jgi:hypothetical protein